MLQDRTDLYVTVTVNGNQELDWLTSNFSAYTPTFDTTYIITADLAGRLDLISYRVYGSCYYWWLIAMVNGIVDIQAEAIVGVQLAIPNLTGWYNFYNQNVKSITPDAANPTNFYAL